VGGMIPGGIQRRCRRGPIACRNGPSINDNREHPHQSSFPDPTKRGPRASRTKRAASQPPRNCQNGRLYGKRDDEQPAGRWIANEHSGGPPHSEAPATAGGDHHCIAGCRPMRPTHTSPWNRGRSGSTNSPGPITFLGPTCIDGAAGLPSAKYQRDASMNAEAPNRPARPHAPQSPRGRKTNRARSGDFGVIFIRPQGPPRNGTGGRQHVARTRRRGRAITEMRRRAPAAFFSIRSVGVQAREQPRRAEVFFKHCWPGFFIKI